MKRTAMGTEGEHGMQDPAVKYVSWFTRTGTPR